MIDPETAHCIGFQSNRTLLDTGLGLPIFIHVPKTGGSTVRAMFGDYIVRDRHQPASVVRSKVSADDWNVWRFAFIRNPWDRVASWYYALEVGRLDHRIQREGRTEDEPINFDIWCKGPTFLELRGHTRNAEKMLTDEITGEPLVDTIYRFEHFDDALSNIELKLGVKASYRHKNANPRKPYGDFRDIYTLDTWEIVTDLCQWEIGMFGYEFDSPAQGRASASQHEGR
jgi:hypothetical protein